MLTKIQKVRLQNRTIETLDDSFDDCRYKPHLQ